MPHRKIAPNANQALELMKEGNERFINGLRSVDSMMRSQDLAELAERGQSPFVILLSCADSRVPAEILFDRGAGDIFVCRIAGNVATPAIMGSIEFAASQFGTPLCVVMGHTRCGAIKATLQSLLAPPNSSPKPSANLEAVVSEILPAASRALREHPHLGEPGEFGRATDEAAITNVRHTLETLQEKSDVIRGLVASGRLKLAGAVCDIATGRVSFISE
jgi:carbonic anhydrase